MTIDMDNTAVKLISEPEHDVDEPVDDEDGNNDGRDDNYDNMPPSEVEIRHSSVMLMCPCPLVVCFW